MPDPPADPAAGVFRSSPKITAVPVVDDEDDDDRRAAGGPRPRERKAKSASPRTARASGPSGRRDHRPPMRPGDGAGAGADPPGSPRPAGDLCANGGPLFSREPELLAGP